jgi:hypothetical protein
MFLVDNRSFLGRDYPKFLLQGNRLDTDCSNLVFPRRPGKRKFELIHPNESFQDNTESTKLLNQDGNYIQTDNQARDNG